jgi:hypothetical protein
MNTGGQFAKSMSVFIGGDKGLSAASVITNGSVSVNLSKSTVDGNSLGLGSFRAVTPSSNGIPYDLGNNSGTSVPTVLKAAANMASGSAAGFTKFTFRVAPPSPMPALSRSASMGRRNRHQFPCRRDQLCHQYRGQPRDYRH